MISLFKKYAPVVGEGLFFGLLSALVFVFAQSLFSSDGLVQKMWRQFEFTNTVQAAYSYPKRNFDYRGVCTDTAFPDYVRCVENGEAFKLEMDRREGGYYCADSSGFNGVVYESTGKRLSCQTN